LNRNRTIDLLRIIALFYMFFQHIALVLLNPIYNRGIINFFYQLVPICAGLFLFSSGYSLAFILKNNKYGSNKTLFFHLVKRSIILIISAQILFLIEFGFQIPDLLISPNILNTIGYFIFISGLILFIPYKKISLSILTVVLIILTFLLEIKKIFIIPFNNGYEPLSPTIIFGFIGLLSGLIIEGSEIKKQRVILISLVFIGTSIFVYYSFKQGLFKIFYEETGRYNISRIFNEKFVLQILFDKDFKNHFFFVDIWNYKMECFFAAMAVIFILFGFFYLFENFINRFIPRFITLPGEYAFANYFYHLIIISILVIIAGFGSFNLFWFTVLLCLIITGSYMLSYLISKIRLLKQK